MEVSARERTRIEVNPFVEECGKEIEVRMLKGQGRTDAAHFTQLGPEGRKRVAHILLNGFLV